MVILRPASKGLNTNLTKESCVCVMTDLTEKEIETIKLIVTGLTTKEISNTLGISNHTVQFHINNIARKMGVTRKIEIAVKAVRVGLV